MNILVFEYITGGGLRDTELPPALTREGNFMLQALTRDLSNCAVGQTWIMKDDRLPGIDSELLRIVPVGPGACSSTWLQHLAQCDAAWPIAPETAGLLGGLCRDVENAGKPLLNSTAEAVTLASSKLATLQTLADHQLPTVPCYRISQTPTDLPFPRICKPDDGVGAEGLAIIRRPEQWTGATFVPDSIAQPLLAGDALSLSALFTNGRARLLTVNRQHVEETEGGMLVTACEVNALPDDDGRWQHLADRVAEAISGLWGYAGIDLILTARGPRILEVNPRLTTSYAGIGRATGENPAAMVIDLLETGCLPPPRSPGGKPITITLISRSHAN